MFRRFQKDEKGATAVVFALTLIPLIFLLGLAIDLGRGYSMQGRLQSAMDAAALAGAHVYRDTGDISLAKTTAENYFMQDATHRALRFPNVRAWTVDPTKIAMTGTISLDLPTTFARLMRENITLNVSTTAQAGGKELELAVMLDTTGSMDQTSGRGDLTSKMADLKLALNDLLDLFKVSLENKKAKIGFAPFSEAVFVGGDAELLRGKQGKTKKVGGATFKLTSCVTERETGDRYSDAFSPLGAHYTQSGECAATTRATPLTDVESTLRAAVKSLKTGGTTAGHLGTAWAYYLLAPNWSSYFGVPLKPYKDKKTIKAAILMTDGEYNMQYCMAVSDQVKGNCIGVQANSQAKSICDEMKSKEIVVYSIGFDLDNATAKATLKACASPGKYYEAYTGSDIRIAFVSIGKELLDNIKLTN